MVQIPVRAGSGGAMTMGEAGGEPTTVVLTDQRAGELIDQLGQAGIIDER